MISFWRLVVAAAVATLFASAMGTVACSTTPDGSFLPPEEPDAYFDVQATPYEGFDSGRALLSCGIRHPAVDANGISDLACECEGGTARVVLFVGDASFTLEAPYVPGNDAGYSREICRFDGPQIKCVFSPGPVEDAAPCYSPSLRACERDGGACIVVGSWGFPDFSDGHLVDQDGVCWNLAEAGISAGPAAQRRGLVEGSFAGLAVSSDAQARFSGTFTACVVGTHFFTVP